MDLDNLSSDPPAQPTENTQAPEPNWDDLSSTPPSGNAPSWDSLQTAEEKYGTTKQKIITGLEGAGKGALSFVSPWIEKKLGANPTDIRLREETNPWIHAGGETAGLGASMLTGEGVAPLLAKAGEAGAAVAGLGHVAEAEPAIKALMESGLTRSAAENAVGITTGAKLAAGAATAAAEMALLQSGDEASKWIENAPQTPGGVVSDIGLAALMGGVGGPALSGTGMALGKAFDAIGLKEFTDRLAFRRANIDPNEMMRNEAENIYRTFDEMNNEITGPTGLKAQAIGKLLPDEVTNKIGQQVQDIATKSEQAIQKMVADQVPARYIVKFQNDINEMLQTVTAPGASAYDHFDAINKFKQNLQDYSKGNWGPFAIPRYHEAYDFLNVTKGLARDVRMGLEDSGVWGKAADLQKDLNKSWQKALPAMKDFENKFMTNVGGERQISADKFNTYTRQGLKSTTITDRQKMLGNFIDAMSNHFDNVDKIYRAAGVENPFGPVGMGTLKESIQKQSVGAKLADLWHEKLGPNSLGSGLGAAVGTAAGHVVGQPLGGAYLGKEILGPVFSGVLKPILDKYPGVDIGAFRQALAVSKSVRSGDSNLLNASKALFQGAAKTFPSHVIPTSKDIEKLDEKTKKVGDVSQLQNVSGKTGYYLPGHEVAIAKTAGDAVNYLNSQRPQAAKSMPLDGDKKVPESQKSQFQKTLTIAQQPLMALKYMQNGTLTSKDVNTIKTIYPDYYQKMCQQVMESMTDHLHNDGFVPYQTKQMLSLFLGQPLDSSLLPASIMSAQGVFAQQAQQKAAAVAAQSKPKSNTSKLSKVSDSYLTQNQASSKRQKFGDA